MKLSAYDFSEFVEREIENLPADVFRSRKTPEAKKLIEEYQPLSKLAVALKSPGLNIEAQTTPEGSEADGIIFESGYRERTLEIQITYSFSYEEALRMELFNYKGHTPLAGPIQRNSKSKEIVAEMVGVDTDEHINRVASDILSLFNKKIDKKYETKMVLLIAFFEHKLSGLYGWSKVYELIQDEIRQKAGNFKAIYLYNSSSNEVYKAA